MDIILMDTTIRTGITTTGRTIGMAETVITATTVTITTIGTKLT
jgi:hypothetical protein